MNNDETIKDTVRERWRAPYNAAALREALVVCKEVMCSYCRDCYDDLPCVNGCETLRRAKAALAAPARNCDRFGDEQDAQLAFLNEVWLISVDKDSMLERDRFENWTDEMRARYAKWLMAKAEGDAQ